jgi:hypothetical protein
MDLLIDYIENDEMELLIHYIENEDITCSMVNDQQSRNTFFFYSDARALCLPSW